MSQQPPDISALVLNRLSDEAALPVPLAITRFAHAPSPTGSLVVSPSSHVPTLFQSTETFDTCYNVWLALPVPSSSQLTVLRQTLAGASGILSLELLQSDRIVRLPLFVMNLWPRLQSLIAMSRNWKVATAVLDCLSSSETSLTLVSDLRARVAALSLDAPVPGFLHFRSSNLPDILSDNWLSDDHVNAAVQKIQLHPDCRKSVAILDSWFLVHLVQHFERHGDFSSRRSRSVDAQIVAGEVTELLVPVYSPSHWSLIHINLLARSYSYTDTLNLEAHIPPPNCLEAVSAWLSHVFHSPIALSHMDRLFCIGQQTDSHSCGVAVISTIAHHAIGAPFRAWYQPDARLHRLKLALWLSQGLDTQYASELSDVEDDTWTSSSTDPLSSPSDSSITTPLPGPVHSVPSPVHRKTYTQLQLPFQRLSREDWLAQEKQRYLDRRAQVEDQLAFAELEKVKKEFKRREQNRKRKCRQRARQRELRASLKGLESTDGLLAGVASNLDHSSPFGAVNSETKERLSACTRNRFSPSSPTRTLPRWKKVKIRPTQRINWCHPLIWPVIDQAAQYVGFPWRPVDIVRRCQQVNPSVYAALRPQRISQWRDHTAPNELKWKDSHLQAVKAGAQTVSEGHGRKGIFHDHPHVVLAIRSCLGNLRSAGVSLSLNTIRGYMTGVIQHHIPEAFNRLGRNGRPFRCSREFVRRFLHDQLGWSIRKGTHAAQKYPPNVNTVLLHSFLRLACAVRDEGIPSCCIVNADQTQVVYNPGDQKTWHASGSRQIPIVGSDDKRAFTVMVGASNSGDLLPLQAVYAGRSSRSLPNLTTASAQEAIQLGFLLDFSRSNTYWSSFSTMCNWVSFVLVPYFQRQKTFHKLPDNQRCILQLDCWAVHRSAQFREWMTGNYPWILLQYVPGGCTGLFQACDVGIQRVLKLAIAKAAHADIVAETVSALQSGTLATQVVNDQTLATLRTRSVGWLVLGYHAVNHSDLVKKAFALCAVPGTEFNLSYESLTSRSARQAILDLRRTNPELYAEITLAQGNQVSNFLEDERPETEAESNQILVPKVEDDGLTVEEVRLALLNAHTAVEAAEFLGQDLEDEGDYA